MARSFSFIGIFLASLLIGGCSSWGGLKLINKSHRLIMYTVNEVDYPPSKLRDDLPSTLPFPSMSSTQAQALLINLRYYNENFATRENTPVFWASDVQYIAPRLQRSISRVQAGERLVLVYKSRPPGNLVRTSLRHTLVLWHDAIGINVLVGEIRRPLVSKNIVSEYTGWQKIDDIDMDQLHNRISLTVHKPYHIKNVNGIDYDSWAFVAVQNINGLIYNMEEEERKAKQKLQTKIKPHSPAPDVREPSITKETPKDAKHDDDANNAETPSEAGKTPQANRSP